MYSGAANAASCKECAIGSFADMGGSAVCKKCPIGLQALSTGSMKCEEPAKDVECVAGKFTKEQDGKRVCVACRPGMYSGAANAASCKECAIGSFADMGGSTVCKTCPQGLQALSTGSMKCEKPSAPPVDPNSPPVDPNSPAPPSTCSKDYNKVHTGNCRDAYSKLCTKGDQCYQDFTAAKTSCANSTTEMKHLKVIDEQCTTLGMTPFEKNCAMIQGCCKADAFGQCPYVQGALKDGSAESQRPKSCRDSELDVSCTGCSNSCKNAEVLKLTDSSFNLFTGNALQNICGDKKCTPSYFKSIIKYTDEMMKPTCQIGKATTKSALKTNDVFVFMCTV
jgi:hypothetical protein